MNVTKAFSTPLHAGVSVVGALLASCAPAPPALFVTPTTALVDDPITVTATGLQPSGHFTIRATTLDQRQRPWVAQATFVGGRDGSANLSQVAPLTGGSYEGIDGMGLFWSAIPEVEGAQIAQRVGVTYKTVLELLVDGEVADEETVYRRFDAPNLTRLEIAEKGVVGVYYEPPGAGTVPGVVVFAGSDGGLESAEWRAALLASRGFAALAVAVFGHPGRPDDLVEIPLEDAGRAVTWIGSRPRTGPIGAVGFSKGSELALSLASRDARIRAVVAISPTAFVWPGVSDGPPERRSSWTWLGKPLPKIPWAVGPRAGAMFGAGPPFRLRLLYEESLASASPAIRESAAIDIAQIRGPVLMVSGDQDGSWPASDMSRILVESMRAVGRAEDVTHLSYEGAGHLLFWDSLPATTSDRNQGQIFGGSPSANARARADSWTRIRAFLGTTLVAR